MTALLPWLEPIAMARQARSQKQLSALVRGESARIREEGPFDITLSAEALLAEREKLKSN